MKNEKFRNIPEGYYRIEYSETEGFYLAEENTKCNDVDNGYSWIAVMPEVACEIFVNAVNNLHPVTCMIEGRDNNPKTETIMYLFAFWIHIMDAEKEMFDEQRITTN